MLGKPFALLLTAWAAAVLAEPAVTNYRTELAPTLAAFYVVDDEGRSVPDDPAVAVIASREPDRAAPETAGRPKSAAQPVATSDKPSKVTVRIEKSPPKRQDAWRCERHGFYFTRDGRCVVPANRNP